MRGLSNPNFKTKKRNKQKIPKKQKTKPNQPTNQATQAVYLFLFFNFGMPTFLLSKTKFKGAIHFRRISFS